MEDEQKHEEYDGKQAYAAGAPKAEQGGKCPFAGGAAKANGCPFFKGRGRYELLGTTEAIEQLVADLRAPVKEGGIAIKTHSYHLHRYPLCFTGQNLVDWLKKHRGMEEKEALDKGLELMKYKIIHHVHNKNDSEIKLSHFYRFQHEKEDDVKRFLADDFEKNSAAIKLWEFWDNRVQPTNPEARETSHYHDGWTQAKILSIPLNVTSDNTTSLLPPDRKKLIHNVGAVAKCQIVWENQSHNYTGMFKGKSLDYGLVRASTAIQPKGHEDDPAHLNFVPGLSLKFMRDGKPAGDMMAMYSTEGQHGYNFFKNDMCTHVPFTLEHQGMAKKRMLKHFQTASDYPGCLGLSEFASIAQDGTEEEKPNFPFCLYFVVNSDLQKKFRDWDNPSIPETFTSLSNIVGHEKLYKIFAFANPDSCQPVYLGYVQLTTRFTTSQFADDRLFFRHTWLEDDLQFKPEWRKVCNFADEKGGHLMDNAKLALTKKRFVEEGVEHYKRWVPRYHDPLQVGGLHPASMNLPEPTYSDEYNASKLHPASVHPTKSHHEHLVAANTVYAQFGYQDRIDEDAEKPRKRYNIHIITGKTSGAGTDAKVYIKIWGDNGVVTDRIELWHRFHNDFEAGQDDVFSHILDDLGQIRFVEITMKPTIISQLRMDWFLAKVHIVDMGYTTSTVEHGKGPDKNPQTWVFPHYSWLDSEDPSAILYHTTRLPQYEQDYHTMIIRKGEVDARRGRFLWEDGDGLPAFMRPHLSKGLPRDERFTNEKGRDLSGDKNKTKRAIVKAYAKKFVMLKHWDRLEAMDELYTDIPPPPCSEKWQEDAEFGHQFVAGIAPNHIMRVTDKLPPKFPVTDKMVEGLLGNLKTLREAVDAKRLFWVDFKDLEGIKMNNTLGRKGGNGKELFCSASMCLFCVNERQDLVPIAIQVGQDPERDLIFTPHDRPLDWLIAKLHLKCSHGNLHQMVTHALSTHLVMEPFSVALNRNLSTSHPVYKLLRKHLRYTIAINALARDGLLGPGGVFDQFIAIGGPDQGHFQLAKNAYKNWDLDRAHPLEDLKRRGLDDPNVLPKYHYREDALAFYDVISKYVGKILRHSYRSEDDLAGDWEIQNWIKDIMHYGHPDSKFYADGHGVGKYARMPGVDRRQGVENIAALQKIVATIIYTTSVGHAAVNFGQYDAYGYIPNMPLAMNSPPPSQRGVTEMEQVMAALPTRMASSRQMAMTWMLSQFAREEEFMLTPNGKYSHEMFTTRKELDIVKEFQADLKQLEETIEKRNKARQDPYIYLLPSRVPCSIAI